MNAEHLSVLDQILVDDLALSADELHPDADLVMDLGFDSLSFAVGVGEIRARLGVELVKEDIFACRTLGDLQRLVADKMRLGAAS